VEFKSVVEESVEVVISNYLGMVTKSEKFHLEANQTSILEFDIRNLPAGFYQVGLKSQFATFTKSFVKQ